jgi:NADPH:quinone reductase-like Zn-dependent oxidoreductase
MIHQPGGPDVLRWEPVEVGQPGPGQVRIAQHAAGLNYIDVYHRTGLYPQPLPFVPGVEGAGVVEAVGTRVSTIAVGDRVAYAGPIGGYAEARLIDADRLVRLPDSISFDQAAAMMLQGMTARMLLRSVHEVKAGETILVHAAAGGVGLILCQWAAAIGATVIGTVSSEAKAELARAHGCDHIIRYDREDVPSRVRALTGGAGVPVVFDSVGKDTFAGSLDSLKRRGLLVCFGTASGPQPPIEAMQLAMKGSLYVTRPALADYIADPAERAELAGELFGHVAAGRIRIEINQQYDLRDVQRAHRDLEGRKTTGSSIFVL